MERVVVTNLYRVAFTVVDTNSEHVVLTGVEYDGACPFSSNRLNCILLSDAVDLRCQ